MLPAIGDHLWQSTLVACLAAGLAWSLRRHAARLRFWIWLGASLKFLLPFAVLVSLGNLLSSRIEPPTEQTEVAWQVFAAELVQPLTSRLEAEPSSVSAGVLDAVRSPEQPDVESDSYALPQEPSPPRRNWLAIFAAIGVIVWVFGSLCIAGTWARRWLWLDRIKRDARPVARAMIARHGLDIRVTASSIEPGVIGILRPVLLMPEDIMSRLTPAQLDAIVCHEAAHVMRRDNLTAFLHMLVEVVFWFHPLVWWIGGRLIEERERACDEAVLRAKVEADTYASAIVDVCDAYRQSRLKCAAGVGGGSLEDRIRRILEGRVQPDAGGLLRAFLIACPLAIGGAPIVFGVMHAPVAAAQPAVPTERARTDSGEAKANVWSPLPGPPPLVVGFGWEGSGTSPTGTRYTLSVRQCIAREPDAVADIDAGIGAFPAMESFEDLVRYAYDLEPEDLVWQASREIPGIRVLESQAQGPMRVLTPPPLARHEVCRSLLQNALETGYGLVTHRDGGRLVVDAITVPPVPDLPSYNPLAAASRQIQSNPVPERELPLFMGSASAGGPMGNMYWALSVIVRGCADAEEEAQLASTGDVGSLPRLSSIGDIVRYAYDLQSDELVWPAGMQDVAVEVVSYRGQVQETVNHSQCRAFLQQALASEAGFRAHFETRNTDLWYLRADEGGTNLSLSRTGRIETRTGEPVDRHVWSRPNAIYGMNASMRRLAAYLGARLGVPVIDQTGLAEIYDFSFVWDPAPAGAQDAQEIEFEAMRAAMQRWWGLVLVPGEAELRSLVVDNIELPQLPDTPPTF